MADEKTLEMEVVAKYLGIEAKDQDEFKTKFEKEFIRKSNIRDDETLHASIVGGRVGYIESSLRKTFRDAGANLKDLDTTGKTAEELIDLGVKAIQEIHTKKVSELEVRSLEGTDEKYTKLKADFDKLTIKQSDTHDLLETTKSKYLELETSSVVQVNNVKMDVLKSASASRVKVRQMSKFETDGFNLMLKGKYYTEMGDNDTMEVFDRATKKRIPNPDVTGTHLSYEDVYRNEAIEHNFFEKNTHAGKPKFATFERTGKAAEELETQPLRKINNSARRTD